jgi:hypothetical protein
VTELGRRIDPLEVDLLESLAGCVDEHRLAESDDPLLDARNGTLEEKEVVVDRSIADESTHAVIMLAKVRDTSIEKTHGVICFLLTSYSVEALPSSPPFPTR